MARHSAEANRMRRDLDELLAVVGEASGKELAWDAAEAKIIDLLMAAIDRKCALEQRLSEAADAKAYVKVAAELRLTEAHVSRLVKQVQPQMPKTIKPPTQQSSRARRAANVRWGNHA